VGFEAKKKHILAENKAFTFLIIAVYLGKKVSVINTV